MHTWVPVDMERRRLLRFLHAACCSKPAEVRRIFLFPGQGSQRVGMMEKLVHLSSVQQILSTAAHVLGYDLQRMCLRGPQSSLDETVHCQPAVVVASLAAVEGLRETSPEIIASCQAVAGFSVGELTALIFAGALSMESGLCLLKTRAEAMHEACLENPGTMATIASIDEGTLQELCKNAEQRGMGEACIANYIYPKGFVVSGTLAAVEYVRGKARDRGSSVKEVAVSGAFHSSLMASAVPKLRCALEKVEILLPKIPVYSNVTGLPYKAVEEVKANLAEQVVRPVQWEASIRHMMKKHADSVFMELGPGKQLKTVLKRIDREAFKGCVNIEV